MGSFGSERKLLLIYNEFDPCCFSGNAYEQFPFKDVVENKIKKIGPGNFDVIIDEEQNKHVISHEIISNIIFLMND